MIRRTLLITMNADWRGALRAADGTVVHGEHRSPDTRVQAELGKDVAHVQPDEAEYAQLFAAPFADARRIARGDALHTPSTGLNERKQWPMGGHCPDDFAAAAVRQCRTRREQTMTTLTIRLDSKLEKALERIARRSGRTKSEIAREALRRQIAAARFRELRKKVLPFAEAQGLLTDEDVFRLVS